MVAQSVARNAMRNIVGKECEIGCDMCTHWFQGDVSSSQNSWPMSSPANLDANGSVPHVYCLLLWNHTKKSGINLARKWKVSNLELVPLKIRVKKIEFLLSPVSYAENAKSTSFTNGMKLKCPRYPLNGRSSILGMYNMNCYLQVSKRKNSWIGYFLSTKLIFVSRKEQEKLLSSSLILKTVLKCTLNGEI